MLKSTVLTVACVLVLASGLRADELDKNFASPPDSAKPRTWWHWITGNVTKDGITKDLEAMKRIGVGGAQCFTVDQITDQKYKGPVRYMSEEWQKLTQHAISECNRLGLELTIHACEGWSESGGPWVKPEQSMQKVVWTAKHVSGPMKFATTLPSPQIVKDYYRDITIFAYPTLGADLAPPATGPTTKESRANRKAPKPPSAPGRIPDLAAKSGMESHIISDSPPTTQVAEDQLIHPDQLVDLTSKMDEKGVLTWDVPEGDWTILRIGHTSTGKDNAPAMPETRGLECDKMDAAAVKAFFDGGLAKIAQQAGKLTGKGWDYVLMDSWEAGCQNWTPKFREEFQKRRGYDPIKFFPALTGRYVDTPEKTERFLWDYRRTIADLIADNHYTNMRGLLKEKNIKLTSEAPGIGMPVCADELQCKGRTDVPMGEFWVGWNGDENIGDSKEAASAAHIYATTYAAAESFTATPDHANWTNDPASLKAQGDRMFCVGINRYVFHRYAAQPDDRKPGITMGPWGINFERTNTWWEPGKAWIDYISRCQYLLQQGLFVADLCYFYGEGAPRNLDPNQLFPKPPAGYDYDGVNSDVIMTRMKVQDGRIVLPDGMSYRALVLPKTDRMSPALLMKIAAMVNAGATVIGPKPVASPSLSDYPHCDDQVKQMADQLWGKCDGVSVTQNEFGKGRIVWGKPLVQVLAGAPMDFEAKGASEGTEIKYIHRRINAPSSLPGKGLDYADIYFVSSQSPRSETVDCAFRVTGMVPELFHADTGKTEVAPIYRVGSDQTIVTLRFDPSGSVFVIFRKPASNPETIVAVSRDGRRVSAEPRSVGKLKIRKATYGVLADEKKSADVTGKVASLVKSDVLRVVAENGLATKDPAALVKKQLHVDYELDGILNSVTINEGQTITIPETIALQAPAAAEIHDGKNGPELTAWEPGSYDVTMASASLHRVFVEAVPSPVEVGGTWKVAFPSHLGAPDSIQLDKLISWTDHSDAGVKYFSGTATYTTEFTLPRDAVGKSRRLQLDLGNVKNLAEVTVNGHDLGVLWKPPFSVDISDVARKGTNKLEVKVTNLWPNRLIGDKNMPEDKHVAWTSYDSYKKDSPLLPSGLLGPVRVRAGVVEEVK